MAIVSIQGERRGRRGNATHAHKCKGNRRHGELDGHTYVEVIDGVVYWIARLQCKCGTWRITRYAPNTWEMVGQHGYIYDKDYPKDLTPDECRILWLQSLPMMGVME